MERYTRVRFAGKLTICHHAHSKGQQVSIPAGRWKTLHRVRFAGKLTPCQTDTWRWSANQWGDGTLRVGSICRNPDGTLHAKVQFGVRTHFFLRQHTADSEHNQWGHGTLHMGSIRMEKLTSCQTTHIATVSISAGRWNVPHGFDSRGERIVHILR